MSTTSVTTMVSQGTTLLPPGAPALPEGTSALPGASATRPASSQRTVWGLGPLQLYTRYWAAHGVQVVQQGEASQIVRGAELFLLTDPRSLAIFKLAPVMDALNWINPTVLFVRLHDTRERGYREHAVTDVSGRFQRFQRLYDVSASRLGRVVLTPDREIAQLWQGAPDARSAWRRLRKYIPRIDRMTLSVEGHVYDRSSEIEVGRFLHDLLETWRRPDSTIARATRLDGQVWVDPGAEVDINAKFIGPVWVGAGRHVDGAATVMGPAILWDDPASRPPPEAIQWWTIEPTEPPDETVAVPVVSLFEKVFKRAFDIVFSIVAILVTLPLYPLIMLAIWLEDGRPFFFAHLRETLGGRRFPCVKFRSMRRNAEQIKAQLQQQNQADGPQFFMEEDPRITRVGRFLRKTHLDELPQFFNVLMGDMSIVGPRPSPFDENQYCPAWREARLSVRPGITGLWQIKRTRRPGSDFQEWIKYDIEYVETRSWWLDLVIIWKTIALLLRRIIRA